MQWRNGRLSREESGGGEGQGRVGTVVAGGRRSGRDAGENDESAFAAEEGGSREGGGTSPMAAQSEHRGLVGERGELWSGESSEGGCVGGWADLDDQSWHGCLSE